MIALTDPRPIASPPKLYHTACLECGHPISAVSRVAIVQTMQAHAEYVNQTGDRATDAHFAENRLNALLDPGYFGF